MKLRVTYRRPRDLVADHDQQFCRGGMLVRVQVEGVELFGEVELELVTPSGAVTVPAQIIQVIPGAGVAVGFDPAAVPALARAVEAARGAGDGGAGEPVHELVDDGDGAGSGPPRPIAGPVVDVHTRYRNASQHEKMQMALRGSRDERVLILRDPTAKHLHLHVLRNPQVQIDEVAAMAGMRTVAPDLLNYIGGRRDWAQRPEIATALVRNPKTPVPLAVRLLSAVPQSELRQLAKAGNIRGPIQREARKRVLS